MCLHQGRVGREARSRDGVVRRLRRLARVVLTLALLALVARIVLVEMGVLYGVAGVSRADRIIAGSFGLGLALASAAVVRKHQKAHGSGPDDKPSTFVDGVAVLAAIGSVVAVLV